MRSQKRIRTRNDHIETRAKERPQGALASRKKGQRDADVKLSLEKVSRRKKKVLEKVMAEKARKEKRAKLLVKLKEQRISDKEKGMLIRSIDINQPKKKQKTVKPIEDDEEPEISHVTSPNHTLQQPNPSNPFIQPQPPSFKPSATIPKPHGRSLSSLLSEFDDTPVVRMNLHRSEESVQQRSRLPVFQVEQELMETILTSPITVICSETGTGKTTQLPQFLVEQGFGFSSNPDKSRRGIIGITQPRRVAAIAMAKRVAHELGTSLTSSPSPPRSWGVDTIEGIVGYQIRHDSSTSFHSNNRIKFMTDGILLQEAKRDLLLRKYSVIVLDEAHERNINTDILLGLLSRVIPLRAAMYLEGKEEVYPLRLVIMSATMRVSDFTDNPSLFLNRFPSNWISKEFASEYQLDERKAFLCKMGYISGLVDHPEKVFYPKPNVFDVKTHRKDRKEGNVCVHFSKSTPIKDYIQSIYNKILSIHKKLPKGGILVFLPGQKEITELSTLLHSYAEEEDKHRQTLTLPPAESEEEDPDFSDIESEDEDAHQDLDIDKAALKKLIQDLETDSDTENTPPPPQINQISRYKLKILPLYSRLDQKQQDLVFEENDASKIRLIVVSTNIAETSITIPGIRYVVDSGRHNEKLFLNSVNDFSTRFISKASASQRAGRAGRWVLGDTAKEGHCYRMYSSNVYETMMPKFEKTEVERSNIEDVVMYMHQMGINDVQKFPFPSPPGVGSVKKAENAMEQLGLLRASGKNGLYKITPMGEAVGKYPLSARFAKLLVMSESCEDKALKQLVVVLACVLSVQCCFDESTKLKELFESSSDGLTCVNVFVKYFSIMKRSQKSKISQFCVKYGIHKKTLYETQTLVNQILKLTSESLEISKPSQLHKIYLQQLNISVSLDKIARKVSHDEARRFWIKRLENDRATIRLWPYEVCNSNVKQYVFIHRNSVLYRKNTAKLPEYLCFQELQTKSYNFKPQSDENALEAEEKQDDTKTRSDFVELDGLDEENNLIDIDSKLLFMKRLTQVNPAWLHELSKGTDQMQLRLDDVVSTPPRYDQRCNKVQFSCSPTFAGKWYLPSTFISFDELSTQLTSEHKKLASICFIVSLLTGKVHEDVDLSSEMKMKSTVAEFVKKQHKKEVSSLIKEIEKKGCFGKSVLQAELRQDACFLTKLLKAVCYIDEKRINAKLRAVHN